MSNTICGICRETDSLFETRCGHYFHQKCLAKWIRKQNDCPCCRSSVTANKNLEHVIRYYNGDEAMLKKLKESELIEILRYFCINKMKNFESIITALMKKGWRLGHPMMQRGLRFGYLMAKNHESLFFLACKEGNLQMVSHLIKLGVDINKPSMMSKFYPIDYAIKNGNLDLVNLLIENGVDLKIPGVNRLTPVFYACDVAKVEIVERLLEFVSDVNEPNSNGSTLLHTLTGHSWDKNMNRVPLAKLLISKGANVNAISANNFTPFHFAVSGDHKPLVDLLLEHGADVNAIATDGSTPLLFASECGSFDLVKKLIEHGANLNVCDKNELNPLHLACKNGDGDIEMVKYLIEKGIDIDSRSKTGATPLQMALLESNYELALTLLDSGCQANLTTSGGISALHALCNSAKSKKSDLQMKILTRLLKLGCCPNAADQPFLETPLLLLSYNDPSMTLVSSLVKHGAEINSKNRKGLTALHRCYVLFGNLKLVKKLISLGADVKAKDKKGRQPIHYILKSFRKQKTIFYESAKYLKIMETLKSAGADLNAKTRRGATAFHYVKGDEESTILKRFHALGANMFSSDCKGRDLEFRAQKRGLHEVLDWIDEISSAITAN